MRSRRRLFAAVLGLVSVMIFAGPAAAAVSFDPGEVDGVLDADRLWRLRTYAGVSPTTAGSPLIKERWVSGVGGNKRHLHHPGRAGA